MADLFLGKERALALQQFDDAFVRLEYVLAREFAGLFREPALLVHRRIDIEPVFQADLIVFLAVAGRGMHRARSRLERDMVAENDQRIAVNERDDAP